MDELILGVIVEEGAGIAILFSLGYMMLFFYLRFLMVRKGMSPNIFMEGFLVWLLADRICALLCKEWYHLTIEPDFYIRVWLVQAGVLLLLILLGLVILYKRKGKGEWGTFLLFIGIMISGIVIYNVMRDFLVVCWREAH